MQAKILLSTPHLSGFEQHYIDQALTSNWVTTLGPNVTAFEKALAQYDDATSALATSSGTAAIHLALLTLGVRPGDHVFCSSFTFVASANPIRYIGAHATLIDAEPDSWNMSPQALARALAAAEKEGTLPKAIIVVDLFGQTANYHALTALAAAYQVPIIEDAAESLGAVYCGRKAGTLGTLGVHSFNGNKMITTSGGGALITDNPDIREQALFLATQAKEPRAYYHHEVTGYNYRMSNVAAGIGRGQLHVLDQRVERRRTIFNTYATQLQALPGVHFQPELPNSQGSRWLTALTLDHHDPWQIMAALQKVGIETRALWQPLHQQPLFRNVPFYPHAPGQDVSTALFKTGLCLPSGSNLTDVQQQMVINTLRRLLKGDEVR
ncbi:DegT/DnrJ/EryC1/StrS family aminotransferase [Loigolactobacillus bifermentans]|uniref:Aminotransferase n=1 Tax=Loigolactobacillus bifermentans DSM 20003 TaxID=1423726 RepID=A0A0R1GN95_9LACO|nr:aminotransferase class I/II-fold pyridoxal phosphate-dependent enzyme [Loigolactobacillus bifermentans]KRK33425.1 aminotransferase [Loigolactobacillus bifermentans DSM 20003]QGG61417.1 aminotransferase class I/II-fold pyridoxal phosphate-dependent enzyme [Loigolactobacillus bifermentans]